MSADAMAWVFRHSPLKGAAFQVHVAIADSVNDQHGYELWMRQGVLGVKARVSRKAVNGALAAMEEAGLLVLLEEGEGRGANRYRFLMPADLPVVYSARAVTPGAKGVTRRPRAVTPGDTNPVTPGDTEPKGLTQQPNTNGAASAAGPSPAEVARTIVREYHEERRAAGQPGVAKFIGACKVVESMLGAGHAADDLTWAVRQAPTISTGALEVALSKRRPQRAAAQPDRAWDRDDESGVLEL